MKPRAQQICPQRNRLCLALAACGIAATACLAPLAAMASRPMFRATAFEANAPMDREAGATAQAIDAAGVAPRSWVVAKAGGGPGVPVVLTPAPTTNPNSLSFSTPLGTTSLTQRATLTNLAGVPSGVFPNLFGSGFFYTTDCPTTPTLPDGSSCNFDVKYQPFGFAPQSGFLQINTFSGTATIGLSGSATRSLQPLVQISPPEFDFPPTTVGDVSQTQFLTIRSVSQVSMNVGTSSVGDFIVPVGGSCYGFLSPMQTCDVGVDFAPRSAGALTGLILISTDISQNLLVIAARGTGRSALGVSPLTVTDRLDFGQQPVGQASSPKPFGIVNNTAAPADITELSVVGDFEVQKGACGTIAPAETCTANLIFKPRALGPRTGSVTVRSPVDPSPYVTPLSGTGVINPNPFLSLSATQLGYGTGIVGAGEVLSLTITSTGQGPVSIARIYALGDFIPTHTCPASLGPGMSCTIEVGFSPRLIGLRTGSLVVDSNAAGSPHTVDLKGTGCTFFSASARGRTLLCSPN